MGFLRDVSGFFTRFVTGMEKMGKNSGMVANHMETILRNQQLQAQCALDALRAEREQEDLEFLTKKEVCAALKISRVTLWRMEKHGQIAVVEVIPGITRIPLSEIRRIGAQRKAVHG
jgi:predicted DNA-binding transcriptional regulator AlpA